MSELDALEITKQLTDHENEIGSLKHRMLAVEEVTKEIHQLATTIEILAVEAKNTGAKVDTLNGKMEALEKKPAENMEKIKVAVITSAITLIVTTILGAILNVVMR